MRYQQHNQAVYRTDRLPTFFAFYNVVQADQRIRVFENKNRGFKVDPMLCDMSSILGLIPVKTHVVTIL